MLTTLCLSSIPKAAAQASVCLKTHICSACESSGQYHDIAIYLQSQTALPLWESLCSAAVPLTYKHDMTLILCCMLGAILGAVHPIQLGWLLTSSTAINNDG